MPYADELARVSLIWTPDPDKWPSEVAVNTFHLHHHHETLNPFQWDTAVQSISDGVAERLVTHWSGIAGFHGAGYQVTAVKVAQLDSAGKYVHEAVTSLSGGSAAGSASGGIMPPEVSVCLSMYGYVPGSFTQNRARKRGRIFLPYIAASVANSAGAIDSSKASDICDAWAAFFNDVQGMHVGTTLNPGSDVDFMQLHVASATGISTQVERLGVDTHFDSQRRRQHQSPAVLRLATINH